MSKDLLEIEKKAAIAEAIVKVRSRNIHRCSCPGSGLAHVGIVAMTNLVDQVVARGNSPSRHKIKGVMSYQLSV